MLSALGLARRIEAGELNPAAVVDLCAEAIAAREAEIGAFAARRCICLAERATQAAWSVRNAG